MKKIIKIFVSVFVSVFVIVAVSACSSIVDYNDNYTPAHDMANTGAPVITAVYDVADTAQVNKLSQAATGTMIKIVGQNLNNVQKVRFVTADESLSGEADLSLAYTYSTAANVVIPSTIGQKAIRLEYTTDMGTASYNFVVPFPALEVIADQYMLQGSRLTLYGAHFNKYKGVKTSLGGSELSVLAATDSTMAVQLPETTVKRLWNDSGTTVEPVVLSWFDGDGNVQSVNIPLRPVENLLYADFTSTQISPDKLSCVIGDDSELPNASVQGHKHLHITSASTLAAWSWNTLDLSENIPFQVDDPANYVYCFEILTPEASPLISSTQNQNDELFEFQFNWKGTYYWAPGKGNGLNTHGQWVTVSMPLDGMTISAKDTWNATRMVIKPSKDFNPDFRMANFRILKK